MRRASRKTEVRGRGKGMAIYRLEVTSGTKGPQSASAKFDYITRSGKYEKGTRDAVSYSLHGNMPKWARAKRRDYWAAADEHERKNGRVFKHVGFALPRELDQASQEKLARALVKNITKAPEGDLPFSLVIHASEKNPHAHLMFHERALDAHHRTPESWFKRANKKHPERGGAAKARSVNDMKWLYRVREDWSKLVNKALERSAIKETVDHRSRYARGLGPATLHLGQQRCALEAQGVRTKIGNYNRSIVQLRKKAAQDKVFKAASQDADPTVLTADYYAPEKPLKAPESPPMHQALKGQFLDLEELERLNAPRRAEAEAREAKEEARRQKAEAEEQRQQEHQRRRKTAQAEEPIREQTNKQRGNDDEGRGR